MSEYHTEGPYRPVAGLEVRADMVAPLVRYREHGQIPGDFLKSVLLNDLAQAGARADTTGPMEGNQYNLAAFSFWLLNQMPHGSYGSEAAVKLWAELGGLRGIEAKFKADEQAAGRANREPICKPEEVWQTPTADRRSQP